MITGIGTEVEALLGASGAVEGDGDGGRPPAGPRAESGTATGFPVDWARAAVEHNPARANATKRAAEPFRRAEQNIGDPRDELEFRTERDVNHFTLVVMVLDQRNAEIDLNRPHRGFPGNAHAARHAERMAVDEIGTVDLLTVDHVVA